MTFTKIDLRGAFVVDLEKREDERGYFARSWCEKEFQERGLTGKIVQANVSYNRKRGTLRGLHYQVAPHEEAKLVRCTRGSIYDVMVDVRPFSPTFKSWYGATLTAGNGRMLYIPEGFAHGFLTLEDETEVTYQVSHPYVPASERGLRYDDTELGIVWPQDIEVISEKDQDWPVGVLSEQQGHDTQQEERRG